MINNLMMLIKTVKEKRKIKNKPKSWRSNLFISSPKSHVIFAQYKDCIPHALHTHARGRTNLGLIQPHFLILTTTP